MRRVSKYKKHPVHYDDMYDYWMASGLKYRRNRNLIQEKELEETEDFLRLQRCLLNQLEYFTGKLGCVAFPNYQNLFKHMMKRVEKCTEVYELHQYQETINRITRNK